MNLYQIPLTIVSLLIEGGSGLNLGNPVDHRCLTLVSVFSSFFFSLPKVALLILSLVLLRPISIPQRFFFNLFELLFEAVSAPRLVSFEMLLVSMNDEAFVVFLRPLFPPETFECSLKLEVSLTFTFVTDCT